MRKAVFLDRDGTINVEKNYLYKIEDFEFIEGVPEAIKLLNDMGYLVIVITNQAGIGRGYYTEEDMHRLHYYIDEELKKYGAHIDAYYYCPHHPKSVKSEYKRLCECRKPNDGMLRNAVEKYNINEKDSYIIGDKLSDVETGKALGIKGILVRTGHKLDEVLCKKKYVIRDDLCQATKEILTKKI